MGLENEIMERTVLAIKLDARRLYERIKNRKAEYIGIFAMKRTRDHFPEVFRTRFFEVRLTELVRCSQESIVALDNFYNKVDELKWYLFQTEDMPQTVEDKVGRYVKELGSLYEMVNLYLEADLGVRHEEQNHES